MESGAAEVFTRGKSRKETIGAAMTPTVVSEWKEIDEAHSV